MEIIQQDTTFQPISIVLETREDAEVFWQLMREAKASSPVMKRLVGTICHWFSNHAKL